MKQDPNDLLALDVVALLLPAAGRDDDLPGLFAGRQRWRKLCIIIKHGIFLTPEIKAKSAIAL